MDDWLWPSERHEILRVLTHLPLRLALGRLREGGFTLIGSASTLLIEVYANLR